MRLPKKASLASTLLEPVVCWESKSLKYFIVNRFRGFQDVGETHSDNDLVSHNTHRQILLERQSSGNMRFFGSKLGYIEIIFLYEWTHSKL